MCKFCSEVCLSGDGKLSHGSLEGERQSVDFFHVQGLSTNPDGFVAFYEITVAQSPPASGAEGRRMGGCYLR